MMEISFKQFTLLQRFWIAWEIIRGKDILFKPTPETPKIERIMEDV